jgi:hypothetical protein
VPDRRQSVQVVALICRIDSRQIARPGVSCLSRSDGPF